MIPEARVMKKLDGIMDPELHISIVQLGLIYSVVVKKTTITVHMTLTSMGCPLFPVIESQIQSELKKIAGVKTVNIKLTFDPPWDFSKMSESAKAELGM